MKRGTATVYYYLLCNAIKVAYIPGRLSGISLKTEEERDSGCIIALTPDGFLNISLNKEVFQSVQLEGKPVQSFRNQFDKYRKLSPFYISLGLMSATFPGGNGQDQAATASGRIINDRHRRLGV